MVAAAAAQTALVAVAAAAEQDCQNDDPPNVDTAEVCVTHKNYLQKKFSSGTPLIPWYSPGQKRCKGHGG